MTPVEAKPAWMQYGNCVGVDPALFFPERDGGHANAEVSAAKEVCAGCPVKSPCLEYALAHSEKEGTWGGTSARERQRIKRARKRAADGHPYHTDIPYTMIDGGAA